MKTGKWIVISLAMCVGLALWVRAGSDPEKTFRTVASVVTLTQGHDQQSGLLRYDFLAEEGRNLVNLALGQALNTLETNRVLALQVDCASTEIDLVVYDRVAGSNILTIATSSHLDVVQQQDNVNAAEPNRERFVATLDVQSNGNATNGLVDGTLMVSGRLNLNPSNGCPRAVALVLDRDRLDKILCDSDFKSTNDVERIVLRAGHGHAIGVMDAVSNGTTNRVLIPHMELSIRRQLSP